MGGPVAGERYAFNVEWLDPKSDIVWKYQFIYYAETAECEMYDVKNRKTFLKKGRVDGIAPEQLYLGGTVTVYARQLKLVDYADEYTRKRLSTRQQRTLAMVKPDAVQHLGQVVQAIEEAGFAISRMRMCHLTKEDAQRFYEVHAGKPFFERLTDFMSSGRVVAMELTREGAIDGWRQLIGPTNSDKARAEAPESLRARFGTDGTCNACHGSDAPETAAAECEFFFGSQVGKCDLGANTALLVVKPHALRAGALGPILAQIGEVFAISALQLCSLTATQAAEFFEVYRGVVPPGEYSGLVEELAAGPCCALEIVDRDGAPPVEALRALAGPADPEIARVLRPGSIRARWGSSKVANAVHVTDLADDGALEVSYFFTILQQ